MRRYAAILVIASLALLAGPRHAPAAERISARINALGGEYVSGVIPDLYTDIGINPAYAFFAERPAVLFGYRYATGFNPLVPYLQLDEYYQFDINTNQVNELSLQGVAFSGWRLALAAQWCVNEDRGNYDDPALETRWGARRTLRQDGTDRSDDFWRVDLALARSVGNDYRLGIGVQGSGSYYDDSRGQRRIEETYEDMSFFELDEEYIYNSWTALTGRSHSFDLQAGLARMKGEKVASELVFEASLDRASYRYQSCYQDIDKDYDSEQEILDYSYYDSRWSDRRDADLWTFGFKLRHAFSGGIRMFAGGSFSTSRYDASWSASQEELDWSLSTSRNEISAGAFDGDGTLRKGKIHLKAAKTLDLHEMIDLHMGFYGAFARTHAEEEPLIRYRFISSGSGGAGEVSLEIPSRLEFTGTAVRIAFPLSIEFEPSRWFSYFAGVTFIGKWEERSTEQSAPSTFMYFGPAANKVSRGAKPAPTRPEATVSPEGTLGSTERIAGTSQTLTLGFSFHYGERLSIDLYTGSAIIPSSVSSCTLDARYRF